MGIPVESSVIVNRPINDAFTFVSNLENGPLLDRGDKTTKISDGQISVGTVFHDQARFMDRRIDTRLEVTEYDPPTKFSYIFPEGSVRGEAHWGFETVSEGTRIDFTGEVDMGRFADLLATVFSRLINRENDRLLLRLKDVLEASDGPAT